MKRVQKPKYLCIDVLFASVIKYDDYLCPLVKHLLEL